MANPIYIPAVFAVNGVKNTIQKTLQVGQSDQDATWNNGWGTVTFTPIASGGKPPKGQDFNGIFNAFGQHIVHIQNGNRYKFDQGVIDNFGGYESGAIIQSDDETKEFRSLVDSNTANPNSGIGTSWEIYAGQGSVPSATSTTAGILRVLNILTSTDVDAALSAAQGKVLSDIFNKFEFSALQNGYVKIPFGNRTFIAQWGVADGTVVGNAATNTVPVTFPIAFPTSCLYVNVSPLDPQGGCQTGFSSSTRFGFNMLYANLSGSIMSMTGNYFAIGY